MIVSTRLAILFEACAHRLGKTPEQLIAHIVRQQHFSNEGAVIGQNLARYHQTGHLPDYIKTFVYSVIYGETDVASRTSRRTTGLDLEA